WTGGSSVYSGAPPQLPPKPARAPRRRSSARPTTVLRATGAGELLIAAGLLVVPASPVPGAAAAVLGAGFLAYLGYGRAVAPESSCGCSAGEDARITWRAFARAAVVLIGGATVAVAQGTWWSAISERPTGALVFLAGAAAVLVALSADLDRWWLLPLRRTRLRVFGHPLLGTAAGNPVPVAASVELLENSLAWQAAAPVVRSALLDHWEDDGWRILQYSGVYGDRENARPVAVVFALDATAGRDTGGDPVVRVSYVDADSGEAVAVDELNAVPSRRIVPMAG
ncbi:MauE/DoxX family redox-associated membrane protein, partial [Streptomyces sp. NPDC056831]|uniref:MauE/DoxX family redox-associated membrane protein n=1 Tax=Streptomyces sp. NPDC056831 TaxID=3345954 RepID=UPI00368E73FA